jgi:uncharacterized protein (TIGR00299 family) protein
MKKKLYLETYSGIAGDMFAAALLDLGADREALEKALRSIPAAGFDVKISRVQKAGIDCCSFDVLLDAAHENHDHDMAYLYGPEPEEGECCGGHGEGHCGHHHHGEGECCGGHGEGHCGHHHHEEGECCGGHGEGHCGHHHHEEGECCGGHGEGHCGHHHHHEEGGCCGGHGEGHCGHHHHEEGECCGGHGEGHCGHHHHEDAAQQGGVLPLESYEEAFLSVNQPEVREELPEGSCCGRHGEGCCGHHHHHEAEGGCCGGHHHEHGHGCGHHHHEHRNLTDCLDIIDRTDMTDSARALARKIFTIIGEAEAKAHSKPLEEVHFHEVGAVDSIVDIVAAAVLFDSLGVSEVIIPALYEGTGTIRCQHGVLPVPVPAVMNIISAYDIPLQITGARGEYVTPTGAAIAAALRTDSALPAAFRVVKTGLGAGKRDYKERTNILRAVLIEETESPDKDAIVKLESDLDDCTGEILGYTLEKLMNAGALDVHYTPIFMKKNRPGWEITVLCRPEKKDVMEEILFSETTTIGIREFENVSRTVLAREEKEIETPFGPALAKVVSHQGKTYVYPEYDSVKALAEKTGVPLKVIYSAVKNG